MNSDTLQLQVASPDEAPHADGFDPSSAVPVEPVHSDGFDPNNAVNQDGFNPTQAVPSSDFFAKNARDLIEDHIAGKITLDTPELIHLNKIAQNGKGAWGRVGSFIYDTLMDPQHSGASIVKGATNLVNSATTGTEKVVNKLQDPLVGLGNAIGKGMEGGSFSDVPQAALEAGKGEAHNAWDLIGGGATGLGNLATSAVSLGNEVGDLALEPFGIDTTGNDIGVQNLQNQAAKQAHEFNQQAGINEQSPLYAAGENIIPMAVPIGGEAMGAKTAAKIADVAVESIPKVAGAALKTVGTTGKVAGPAALAATEVSMGHPYGALITLAAGYGPDGMPIVGKLKHAIIDKGFGGINELGNTLLKTPDGMPVMESLQQSVGTEIDRLQQQSQDIIKRAGPDKTSDAFKTTPDGNPLYESDELSGDAKKLRDLQDRIENLQGRSDMLGKFIGANKLISGAAKLGIQTGLNVGGAGAIGAAFAGTQAAPGDNQAIQQGFGAGAALGALGVPIANREGTLAMGRDALISRGSKVIDPVSLQGLSPEARAHVTTLAGMADAIGRKVVVIPPDQLLQMVSPNKPEIVSAPEPAMAEASMPPTTAKDAPNGVTIGNTLYLNRDAIGTGVGNHELSHATSEFFGKALAEADPELMDIFNQTYQSRLSRTGDYEFNPQSERDAEVGRIALQNTPLETFYGGEKPGDIIKRMAFNLAQKIPALRAKANVYQVDSVLNAPYSPADLQAIKQRMFEVGEIAKRGSAPRPPSPSDLASATLAPETQQNTPTESIGTPATPKTVDPQTVNDAVAGMVGLGLKKTDAQMKVNAAVQDLTNEGKELTTEAIVSRAAQRAVPKQEGLQSAMVVPSKPVESRPVDPSSASAIENTQTNQNSSPAVAHPDYESIRKTAEDAKREELKSSKAKDKESKVERAGLDAMAKAHADFVGPDSPLITQRTTRFGRTSISGRAADPSDPFNAHLIQQANLSPKATENMNALEANRGKPIVIDYTHAPEQEEASGISRKFEQAESTASDRAEGTAPGRKLSKSYVPTSFTYNAPSKTFEVNGFSPDKFLNNAAQLIPWAQGKGLKGWESINDPQFVQDFQAAMKNGRNGYTISGKPIEGTEATPVKVNPDYNPTIIPKDKADLLNAMLGNDSAKVGVRTASPEKLDKQALAAKNSPFYEPSTGETNKIRSMLGDEGKLLESTSETLRPDLIDNVRTGNVADEHTLRPSGFTGYRSELVSGGTPNQHHAAGGYMPSTEIPKPLSKTAEAYSLKYNGIMGDEGKKQLHLFTDPVTKSTFSVPVDASGEDLRVKLQSVRDRFGKDQPDFMPATQFKDAIAANDFKGGGNYAVVVNPKGFIWPLRAGQSHEQIMSRLSEEHPKETFARGIITTDGKLFIDTSMSNLRRNDMKGLEDTAIEMGLKGVETDESMALGWPGRNFMPSSHPNAIKEAAIRTSDGRVYTDAMHFGAYMKMIDEQKKAGTYLPYRVGVNDVENGFVDNKGSFLSRSDALKRAKSIGQLTKIGLDKAKRFYGNLEGGDGLESLTLARAKKF